MCFLKRHFSSSDTKKLTVAPIEANTMVLITSDEPIVAIKLSKVPPAVPIKVG
ncbi:hypothetical protein [Flavobacterium sp.]|uniref:hypothetical protein n=1 Tax=Flavobacterium sp. TaxID=239 RepID=UPI00260DB1E7|nr:hypothetical protein [Flavobacterium sp.]